MRQNPIILAIAILLSGGTLQSLAQSELSPGQHLANEMRQTQLLNYAEISGALKTKGRRGKRSSMALRLTTAVKDGQWQSIFQATDPTSGAVSQLTILRSPEKGPQYYLASAPKKDLPLENGEPLAPDDAMASFAGSNFWMVDLGLEFFYWPTQKLLRDARIKMRKGISCFVLESQRDGTTDDGYFRVRSWISRDHGGLIYAEAYGANGKRIKTFEVSDVEKINGEWKLKELRIRNEIARSTTELIFNN
jgi:hypothetical protein